MTGTIPPQTHPRPVLESPDHDTQLVGREGHPRRQVVRETIVILLGWSVGAAVFFSAQWSSGFDRIMGNTGDSRLMVYLNEQWFLALRGSQPWRDPPFFYPTKGLLGYTDTFFLWQIFFAPFRFLGADPFLAAQLTVIAMSLLAFICFVILVRMVFRPPMFVAIIGALIFVFANNLAEHIGSLQIFGIYSVPPIALIGLLSWKTRVARPELSIGLGVFFGALCALLLFSTYYAGWFSLFAAALVALLTFLFAPRVTAPQLVNTVRTGWRSILGGLGGFAIGIIPFLATYLPVVSKQGTRSYSYALTFAPKWNDVVNVGPGDRLWGHLFQHLWSAPSPNSYELDYAVTPILFLTMVIGGAAILWGVGSRRTRLTPMLRVTLALCCTALLLTILPINTWFGSAWVVVWHVPGATAIRAIDRVQLAADLVMALALVALCGEAVRHLGRLRRSTALRALGIALLCVIALEQVNTMSGSEMRRSVQNSTLDAVPPVPAGCTSFFVIDSRHNKSHFYEFQTEAMLISQRTGLPTLNGYSGDEPSGWGLLFPNSPSYPIFVQQWENEYGLTTGVCELDLGTMSWKTHPLL